VQQVADWRAKTSDVPVAQNRFRLEIQTVGWLGWDLFDDLFEDFNLDFFNNLFDDFSDLNLSIRNYI